jgi:hypothetical protein
MLLMSFLRAWSLLILDFTISMTGIFMMDTTGVYSAAFGCLGPHFTFV